MKQVPVISKVGNKLLIKNLKFREKYLGKSETSYSRKNFPSLKKPFSKQELFIADTLMPKLCWGQKRFNFFQPETQKDLFLSLFEQKQLFPFVTAKEVYQKDKQHDSQFLSGIQPVHQTSLKIYRNIYFLFFKCGNHI